MKTGKLPWIVLALILLINCVSAVATLEADNNISGANAIFANQFRGVTNYTDLDDGTFPTSACESVDNQFIEDFNSTDKICKSIIQNKLNVNQSDFWDDKDIPGDIDINELSNVETFINATLADAVYVSRSDWTTIDDYPVSCTNQFTRGLGDTLVCETVDISADTNLAVGNGVALTDDTLTVSADLGLTQSATGLGINPGVVLNRSSAIGLYQNRTDWLTHDNYPTSCTNQFTRGVGDTLTCETVDISADSNLAVSTGIILTGDTLSSDETYINSTIDERTKSILYNATSNETLEGTYDSGNLFSIQVLDGLSYNVSENAGSSPLLIQINFTGVVKFNTVNIRSKYNGGLGHEIEVQSWNSDSVSWEKIGEITDQTTFEELSLNLLDPVDHVSGGVVSIRFDHLGNGNSNHDFFLDFIELVDGFTTSTNSEHDGLSGRDNFDTNHPAYALNLSQHEEAIAVINVTLAGYPSLYLNYTDAPSCTPGDFWTYDGSTWACDTPAGAGTITSVLFDHDGGLAFENNATSGVVIAKLRTDCATDQILKNTSIGWVCAADDDTTYSAGNGITLAGTVISVGSVTTNNITDLPICAGGEYTTSDGAIFTCSTPTDTTYTAGNGVVLVGTTFSVTGVTPQNFTGTLTDTKFCTYDGGQNLINCTSDGGAGGGVDSFSDSAWMLNEAKTTTNTSVNSGNVQVNGTLGVTGNTVLTGDIAVNGGDITTNGNLIIDPVGGGVDFDASVTISNPDATDFTTDLKIGTDNSLAYSEFKNYKSIGRSYFYMYSADGVPFNIAKINDSSVRVGTAADAGMDIQMGYRGGNEYIRINKTGGTENTITGIGGTTFNLATDGGAINLKPSGDATNYFSFSSDATDLTLATTDGSDLVLDPAGNNVNPGTDNTDLLGQTAGSTIRWADVKSVLINGADICGEIGCWTESINRYNESDMCWTYEKATETQRHIIALWAFNNYSDYILTTEEPYIESVFNEMRAKITNNGRPDFRLGRMITYCFNEIGYNQAAIELLLENSGISLDAIKTKKNQMKKIKKDVGLLKKKSGVNVIKATSTSLQPTTTTVIPTTTTTLIIGYPDNCPQGTVASSTYATCVLIQ